VTSLLGLVSPRSSPAIGSGGTVEVEVDVAGWSPSVGAPVEGTGSPGVVVLVVPGSSGTEEPAGSSTTVVVVGWTAEVVVPASGAEVVGSGGTEPSPTLAGAAVAVEETSPVSVEPEEGAADHPANVSEQTEATAHQTGDRNRARPGSPTFDAADRRPSRPIPPIIGFHRHNRAELEGYIRRSGLSVKAGGGRRRPGS
jgi:hypothetical protein